MSCLFPRSTRREFMAQIVGGLVILHITPCAAVRRGTFPPRVSFFLDQPYWDPTGLEKPYLPPSGARSGPALDEEALRRALGWL